MLYLIGLGLDLKDISFKAIEIIKECSKVYLESYTNELPYSAYDLEKLIGKKITKADREFIEQKAHTLIDESKKQNIALLIYGSPLSATTHTDLILRAKEEGVEAKILHNSGIFVAVASTGLQLYKFGKTASLPAWKKNYTPTSFIDIVMENQTIKAHTLILVDIGLSCNDAISQLEEASKDKINFDKMIICSLLGTDKEKIYYDSMHELKKKAEKIQAPFCFIIPSDLHFKEQEMLEKLE
jgi:diphthine synthase